VTRARTGDHQLETGAGVGLLAASAVVPGTFSRSLSPRSALDQGLVTGLAAGGHYLLTVGTQDALQAAVAKACAGRHLGVRQERAVLLAADLAAIPLGLALRRLAHPLPGESLARGLLRQTGWRYAATGLGGALLLGSQAALEAADRRLGAGGRVAAFPVAVPAGLALAGVLERRRLSEPEETAEYSPGAEPSTVRSLAVAGAMAGGLALSAYAEHAFASFAGRRLAAVLPGSPQLWRLTGHAGFLGLLAVAGLRLWDTGMHRIEAGTSADEPVLQSDEATRWTSATVSGGPGSVVSWHTLGREGRRHALTYVRPQPLPDRPPGVPDLSIETVMGEPARATPVQVYVSLDSAPTARERVELALREMERTGAFDRSLIMLVSPTGTGYVNYVAVAATQYLALGDVATVTLQYSKRPSPLSLGKVKAAREQNRLLWLSIVERIHARPQPWPRLVVFGESLGAHTSQDVFLHWGTLGLQALGIDRALWIGTPYGSAWMRQVTGPDRLDVDRDTVAVVNDFAQLEALDPQRRGRLRYVLVSHDNDGVTKFGTDLLTRPPAWLGPDRPRPAAVPGGSPRGVPPGMRWRPITTFFQSLVDMKNAQTPGAYRAWAHDYRPDLTRFINEVYGLDATPEQLGRVEAAVASREAYREQLFASSSPESPASPESVAG
jgi:uncharacterized membrane protein